MSEIAAHAALLLIALPGRACCPGVMIAELDMSADDSGDRLHTVPARLDVAEERPGCFGKAIGLAVTAAEQVDEDVVGQFLDRMLNGVGRCMVGLTVILDREIT